LALRLSAAGHAVKVANSRGPETIAADVLASGARAVTAAQAVEDVEVVIVSIPLNRLPDVAPLIARLPAETVVIDTSNYYPIRDGKIDALEAGQVESVWVAEQFRRPIAKAWNSIFADSLAKNGRPPGSPDRIAIPVAADRQRDRTVAMQLVEQTGLDAFDAGALAESWRQQPGAPCYCTDLTREQLPAALAAAERSRLPRRRELSLAAVMERLGEGTRSPDADYAVRLNRALFM
jgi:predicted dinucleotide-binding enzyme